MGQLGSYPQGIYQIFKIEISVISLWYLDRYPLIIHLWLIYYPFIVFPSLLTPQWFMVLNSALGSSAGLPDALLSQAQSSEMEAPQLRVHPHIMAATYRPGAEYHCHKDSYSGTDNQRSSATRNEELGWDEQLSQGGCLQLIQSLSTTFHNTMNYNISTYQPQDINPSISITIDYPYQNTSKHLTDLVVDS